MTARLLPAVLLLAGCSNRSTGQMPAYVHDFCVEYTSTLCEKLVGCSPTAAKAALGVTSASECSDLASRECAIEGGDCANPTWPPESQLDSCLAQTKSWTCAQYLASPEGPSACQGTTEPCPDPVGPDAGQSPVDLGSSTLPDQPKGGACPYTTSSFSCASACSNLWALVQTCSGDTSLPSNLQAAFKAMSGLSQVQAITACKAFCVADSPQYLNQWKCFQAAPTASCTAIAACTIANCP